MLHDSLDIYGCEIEILSAPVIQVIPTEQISKDSYETTLAMAVGIKPFDIGVSFTVAACYSLSSTRETANSLSYQSELERSDSGYVGMVRAYISALLFIEGCKCPLPRVGGDLEVACAQMCRTYKRNDENWKQEFGCHETRS